MPPFWDMESFYATIEKYRQINFDTICMAHFGYIHGDEVKSILDEAVAACDTWREVYDRNADRLDDIDHMVEVVFKEINPAPIYSEILSLKLKILAGGMTGVMKLLRKEPIPLYKHLIKGIVA